MCFLMLIFWSILPQGRHIHPLLPPSTFLINSHIWVSMAPVESLKETPDLPLRVFFASLIRDKAPSSFVPVFISKVVFSCFSLYLADLFLGFIILSFSSLLSKVLGSTSAANLQPVQETHWDCLDEHLTHQSR